MDSMAWSRSVGRELGSIEFPSGSHYQFGPLSERAYPRRFKQQCGRSGKAKMISISERTGLRTYILGDAEAALGITDHASVVDVEVEDVASLV